MIFEVVELQKNRKYTFIIGTRAKPDNYLRARIREQIGEAMSSLGREPDSYAVSIVKNEEESGEKPLPPLLGSDRLLPGELLENLPGGYSRDDIGYL